MILSWPLPVLGIVVCSHLGVVLAQNDTAQCVKVTNIDSSEACPCTEVEVIFTMEGSTSVADNTVNIALVLDGSASVGSANFDIEKEFAKNVTAAFAENNLFDNGGSASYVQFSYDVVESDTGTFYSLDDFNDFVDNNEYGNGGAHINSGINAARELLNNTSAASASFMFVVVDGNANVTAGDDARADGIIVFAIGVGEYVSEETLLDIAGSEDLIFTVDEFDELESLVDDIVEKSTVSCPATGVTLDIHYGANVVSTSDPDATIIGDTGVAFTVDNLEDNPKVFDVVLNTCEAVEPLYAIVSITYKDGELNSPDLTALKDIPLELCPPDNTTSSPKPSLRASTKASPE